MGDKKAKSLKLYAAVGLISAMVIWVVLAVLVGYLSDIKAFTFFPSLIAGIGDYRVWLLWAAVCGGIAVVIVLRNTYSARRVLKINDGEDARWLTDADIRSSENMTLTSYSRLAEVRDGVPVYAKQQGKDLTVVLAKPIHTLVVGTTGSGKTSGFVDPVVQILARTKTKPGLVVTDPKGELYRSHAATLKKQGYKLLVVDLADPYHSARWNPFYDVILKTRLLTTLQVEQQQGKYTVDKRTFLTYAEAEAELQVYRQQLTDEVFIDLQDVIYTLCPIESSQEPTWQKGARDFIFALTLAMWEDLRDGYCAEEEFNLFTLYKNISDYAKGECEAIRDYLGGREKFSKAEGIANSVLVSTDRTLSSYLSEVNGYMTWLADSGVCAMTAGSDIELSTFDDEPTALFLKIPDEKENRHRLVTLMITQMYKILVYKARENRKNGLTQDEELRRNVYMIMDEFGNMPKFNSIDKIITVGRSRHIFMIPIIQDYAQLDNKYGKELAAIIRSNCNIKAFIGSTDKNTINEFSELCGKTKQRHVSFSDQTTERMGVSTSAESKPLVYPSELEVLNDPPKVMGNAIVLAYGKYPLRSVYTPVFKAREIYRPECGEVAFVRGAEVFDEEAHYFNIVARTNFIRAAEAAKKEQEKLISALISEDPDEDIEEGNSMYAASLRARIEGLKYCVPHDLYEKLRDAAVSGDYPTVCELCDEVMDNAMQRGDRFTLSDGAQLKVFAENIWQRQQEGNHEI